jgi:hypothetical protein
MNKKLLLIIVFLFLISLCSITALDKTNLTSCWNFNNNLLDSVSGYNGTITGTVESNTTFYKLGTGSYEYENGTVTTGTYDLGLKKALTVTTWAYFYNFAIANTLYRKNDVFVLDTTTGGNILCTFSTPWGTAVTSDIALSLNNWYFIGCVYNGTNICVVINETWKCTAETDDQAVTRATPNLFGKTETGNRMMYGYLDDSSIWNRGLNSVEIGEIYNSGTGWSCPFYTPPPEPPSSTNTTILLPANNNITTSTQPYFNFSYLSTGNNLPCTLYLNLTPYGTNTSVFNNTITTIRANATLGNGKHNWSVTCNTTSQSLGRNITIDTTNPTINSIAPTNNYITNNDSINFTYYASDETLKNCTLHLSGAIERYISVYAGINLTNGVNNSIWVYNFTQGTWVYEWYCYDEVNHIGSSATRTIKINLNPPVITFNSPLNNSKNSAIYNISFQITGFEATSFIYSIQSNITYSNGSIIFTMNFTDTGEENKTVILRDSKQIYENNVFNWTAEVCDGHTGNDISDLKAPTINKDTKAIEFEKIKITPVNNVVFSHSEKLSDRYTFGFDLSEVKTTEFILHGEDKLQYYPNSIYKGHFIDGKNKLWIDFEDFPEIEVIKIDDYNYRIISYPTTKELKAESIGKLNCIKQTSYFNTSIEGLDIALYDFATNTNVTNFNVTFGAITQQTNNGTIHYDNTTGNFTATYKSPGYANKDENITINGSTLIYSAMYKENSILVNIFDEDTGAKINNSEILFDANITYYQNFITTNGSVYVSGLPSAFYDVRVRSSNYVDRHYFATLNSDYALINAYLLNNTNAVILTIKSEATDKFIEGVLITLNRRINGSWSNVGSQYTDGVGSARFGMKEGETYNIILSAVGYDTKQISLTPFESAYTIYIQGTNTQLFFTLFDKLSYSINPKTLVIPPYSYNNPITCFNLTISSPLGYMDYFGLSANFSGVMNISNVTGSATGGIAQFCLDFSANDGYNISVDYWIKATGESLYTGSNKYFIVTSVYGSTTLWANVTNTSMFGVLNNYKDMLPMTWKIIIMLFCAIGLMLVFAQWIPPVALGWIGIAVIGIFSYVWFQSYILIIMILVVVFAVLYMLLGGRENGGS